MSKKNRKPTGEDKSPHVFQRDKIKEELSIRTLPWTDKQKQVIETILDKNTRMVILDGLPGTGKTVISVFCALQLMNAKKVSDLVYIRSLIQAKDGQTGYLPGEIHGEKTIYFNIPLMDKLQELLPKPQVDRLIKEERIITYPTSMLRGYQFQNQVALLEECQNMTFDSLVTGMTRIGMFGKLILLGDSIYQNDLGSQSGFKRMISIFNDDESRGNGIHYFKFGIEDIKRSPLVRFVMEKIEKSQQPK